MQTKKMGQKRISFHLHNFYHAEINEQNSGENWSEGAEGGGWSTMASISS